MNRTKILMVGAIVFGVLGVGVTRCSRARHTLDLNAIHGTDSNGNGVRDDVESMIEKELPPGDARMAALRKARWVQVYLEQPAQMESTIDASFRASACLNAVIGSDRGEALQTKIESATVNTVERNEAYIRFNVRASGGVYKTYSGDLKYCDFPVRDKK